MRGRRSERLQRRDEVEEARLHAHRVPAVEPVDLATNRGDRLGGAQPVDHGRECLLVVDVADDAGRADARLAQRPVGREQADVAGEEAGVVREAEQRQLLPDRLHERPDEVGEVPDVEAEHDRAAAGAAQLLADRLRATDALDSLAAELELDRRAVPVRESGGERRGPGAQDAHVVGLVRPVHVRPLVVHHHEPYPGRAHRLLLAMPPGAGAEKSISSRDGGSILRPQPAQRRECSEQWAGRARRARRQAAGVASGATAGEPGRAGGRRLHQPAPLHPSPPPPAAPAARR